MWCIWVVVDWVMVHLIVGGHGAGALSNSGLGLRQDAMHLSDSWLGHSAFDHRRWWCRVIVDWVTGSVSCIMGHSGQHWVWQDWECVGSQAGYGAFGHSGLNHSVHGYVYTCRVIVSWCQLIQDRRHLLTGSCITFFIQFVWSLHWLLIMILTLVACCLEEAMLHPTPSSFSCNGCYWVFWELHHKCHNVKNKTPSENLLHLKVQSHPQMP